jgi:hypothetical protein
MEASVLAYAKQLLPGLTGVSLWRIPNRRYPHAITYKFGDERETELYMEGRYDAQLVVAFQLRVPQGNAGSTLGRSRCHYEGQDCER